MRGRDWISTRVGAVALAVAIFAIGGASRWAQALVAITVAFAIAPIVRSRRTFARISPLVALLGVAIALSAIQLLPLPHALVEWLSPTMTSLRDDGAALFGFEPHATITADVPATRCALIFFVTLLGIAVVMLRIATSENGRFRILATVAALCGGAALVGDLHTLLGLTKLYGLIAPLEAQPRVLGPLFNSNHFGCLMALGSVLSMGLVMYQRQPSWMRVAWLAIVALCGLTALATLSRGASIGLVSGAFVVVGTLITQRWLASSDFPIRRSRFLTSSLPIGVVAVSAVVVVLYAGAEGVTQQLENTSITEINAPRSKFVAWRSAEQLVDESPWVGIGRGALEPVFVRVHPASAFATYPFLENEYIQAIVDFGVPGAMLLAFGTLWLLVAAIRRWRDGPLVASALGGLVAVMLQSNVDFGIELLGLAAPLTAVAATLVYVPLRESSGSHLALARWGRVVHVLVLAFGAVLLLSSATTTIDEDHKAMGESPTMESLREVAARHPLDYYNFARAAQILGHAGDHKAIVFLNHALTLHPTHPGLHLVAARMLVGSGHPQQATIEYALALPAAADRRQVILEIVKRFPPPLAGSALGVDPLRLDDVARTLDEQKAWTVELAWLEHVLDLKPQLSHACELMFQLAAKQPDLAEKIIANPRCTNLQPSHEDRYALAIALVSKKLFFETTQVLADVASWPERTPQHADAWIALCDAQIGLGHWDDGRHCLRTLDTSGLVSTDREPEIANRLEFIDRSQRTMP
jgi:O-antigen ligase